jgi:enoyl-CoA hydratase/carnithine racemase
MKSFAAYSTEYQTVRMERRDGILQVSLHSDGKAMHWNPLAHTELPYVFQDIANDPDNRIVILTGTGDEFLGPRSTPGTRYRYGVMGWDTIVSEGLRMLRNMMAIEVPMISAVNGPATRHSELALLCDIVLASENASFHDSGHFENGQVPGDGVNIVYPMLLGLNRARYFLLMGQSIDAQEAFRLGLVNEVLPREQLLERAWEIAEQLAQHPTLQLKYTRRVLIEDISRRLHDRVGHSLALEALADQERPDRPKPDIGA